MCKDKSVSVMMDYMIDYEENEAENKNRSHMYDVIDPGLDMDTYTNFKMCRSTKMAICIK